MQPAVVISEADFLLQVMAVSFCFRWKVHHVRPAWSKKGWRTPVQGDVGYPDLTLLRAPRVIVAELKTDKGQLTPEQKEWLEAFRKCPGVETYLWRPRMWSDIVDILR